MTLGPSLGAVLGQCPGTFEALERAANYAAQSGNHRTRALLASLAAQRNTRAEQGTAAKVRCE
jgi:hypothetical protein